MLATTVIYATKHLDATDTIHIYSVYTKSPRGLRRSNSQSQPVGVNLDLSRILAPYL